MRATILFCFLVVGAHAACSDSKGTGFLDGLESLFCSVGDALKSVGNKALEALKAEAGDLVLKMGSAAINALNQLSAETAPTSAPVGRRSIDPSLLLKVLSVVQNHNSISEDLIKLVSSVSEVAVSKIEILAKQYLKTPSDDLLRKIVAYFEAHHALQDIILQWVEKNGVQLAMTAVKDLLPKKRSLLEDLEQLAKSYLSKLQPLVNDVKTEVEHLSTNLLSQLVGDVLPHISELLQHGESLLAEFKSTENVVVSAVKDVISTLKTESPDQVKGILKLIEDMAKKYFA